MIFWILATIVTLISLAALYYAARGSAVNASATADADATTAHFKLQLSEIEADIASGRLSAAEAEAAKAELARELIRVEADAKARVATPSTLGRVAPIAGLVIVAGLSFGVYWNIGDPDLPSQPLAERERPAAPTINVADATARVEQELLENPDDARGWAVLAPIYMQSGRFDEAVAAFRRILELLPASADTETDLAEAIMMANEGSAEGEPIRLLQSAAARDPEHIRSRFYLAGEATRVGDFESAVAQWQALLALGGGDEPWVPIARNGIAVAEAGLRGEPLPNAQNQPTTDPDQEQMIRGMVESLQDRLSADGGTIEEWTQLVRSLLVLGELSEAQTAYDAAKLAFPTMVDRALLDNLALGAGLK